MNKLIKSALATTALVVAGAGMQSAAYADGLYIGAGVYKADYEGDVIDDDDTVPAVFIGYNFIDTNVFMLSAELGYYQLADGDGSIGGSKYAVEADAFTLAGVASIPLGPFIEVYAKAGIASVDIDVKVDNTKVSDDGEEGFGGVGMSFDILDTIDIYAEYLMFDTDFDSEMIGVGIRLDF